MVGGSLVLLIALNILAYCITNVVMANAYSRFHRTRSNKHLPFILLVILLISPYRIHLAVHALKDTLIIFFLTFFVVYRGRTTYAWLSLFPLLLLRIYASFYGLMLVRRRFLVMIVVMVILLSALSDLSSIKDLLLERNEAAMHSRDFDAVPAFEDYGLLGTLLRMIVWPLFAVTGGYVLVSPALLFFPLAFEVVMMRAWCYRVFGHLGVTLGLLACLAVIAAVVNSFTAFIRYAYPALAVMPFAILVEQAKVADAQRKVASRSRNYLLLIGQK